jgi:hypothetical protein
MRFVSKKKRLNKCSASFPVPSCKIAFLFGKAQGLLEELSFFTIQLVLVMNYEL